MTSSQYHRYHSPNAVRRNLPRDSMILCEHDILMTSVSDTIPYGLATLLSATPLVVVMITAAPLAIGPAKIKVHIIRLLEEIIVNLRPSVMGQVSSQQIRPTSGHN